MKKSAKTEKPSVTQTDPMQDLNHPHPAPYLGAIRG